MLPVELTKRLVAAHGLSPENVGRVVLALPRERERFEQGHVRGSFDSEAEAVSSAPFH